MKPLKPIPINFDAKLDAELISLLPGLNTTTARVHAAINQWVDERHRRRELAPASDPAKATK